MNWRTKEEGTIKPFSISVTYKDKAYIFKVEQTKLSEQLEEFTATCKNSTVIVNNNRPWVRLMQARKKIIWKIIKPELKTMVETKSVELVEDVFKKIKDHIASVEQKPFDWSQHPKNVY